MPQAHMPESNHKKTAGLPGVFAELMWVDSPDFGAHPKDRRNPFVYDVDPAPLARVLAAVLDINETGIGRSDLSRIVADDPVDGPIHIVHLAAVVEATARRHGGSLATPASTSALFDAAVNGNASGQLVNLMAKEGFGPATERVRALSAQQRYELLESLIEHWSHPVLGLTFDITHSGVFGTR
ncbi:hypothetical protein ACIRPK_26535 [Kitasatospora sp. NPDC101801]|uniref:hypothetical protein n=1 Tax=Kitasatospora sp. NPDC101801 TaxID=3364103 RepID=UPI0037FEC86D